MSQQGGTAHDNTGSSPAPTGGGGNTGGTGNSSSTTSNTTNTTSNSGTASTGANVLTARTRVNQILAQNRDFEGANPEVGAVLGLKSEKITKKIPFNQFREKLVEHIKSTFTHSRDIACVVKKMVDPMTDFDTRNKPADVDPTTASIADKYIFEAQIKQYVNKLDKLKDNQGKLFSLIWGQCSSGLQTVVAGQEEFESKEDETSFGCLRN